MTINSFGPANRWLAIAALLASSCAAEESQEAEPASKARLFAAEIHVGENWDTGKAPQEQAYFAEHSANIKRLREAGSMRLGARYSDKGLIVLIADSEQDARVMLDQDPSFAAGTFQYQLYPFSPFHWSEDPTPD